MTQRVHMSLSMCFIIIIDLLFLLLMMITFLALDAIYLHIHTYMSEHQKHIDSEIERKSGAHRKWEIYDIKFFSYAGLCCCSSAILKP